MKSLVVFYSFEGNCELVAANIKAIINADLLQLKPKKDMSSKGFSKFLWGGKKILMNEKPELEAFNINIDDYDLIFIGTPVWASSFTPAINTFLTQNRINNKKIALFCCHNGGKGKVLEKMKNQLTENSIIGEIDFLNPTKSNKDEVFNKIQGWLISINVSSL